MEEQSTFLPLLLITGLAVVVPLFASRIRIVRLPIVVGEILAGIAIGRSGLNLVEPSPTLNFLAEFGFTFLMFLSGLEVSFQTLFTASEVGDGRPRWKRPIPLALLSFGLTILLAMLAGLGLTSSGLTSNPILMGLILSTTSLGIVMPILKERQLMSSGFGQTLLITSLISDFSTLLLLSIAIAIISRGLSLDIILFLALLGAFMTAARISRWVSSNKIIARISGELAHATAQIHVRGAFALMVIWAVLAEALGVEVILGAFLAGAILSVGGQGQESTLREKLDAIGYGFFIPIFFIMAGTRFDLQALLLSPRSLILVTILVIAAYLIKLIPSFLFRSLFSWRETIAAGVLLSSRLSLIIAASAIALDLGIISTSTNSAVLLVAMVTCTFSPILFNRILAPTLEAKRRRVVILGTGQLAVLLGQRLRQSEEEVIFIGPDQAQLARLSEQGFDVCRGDPTDQHVLEQAGLPTARALLAVTKRPEIMSEVCRMAIGQFGVPSVIARADDSAGAQSLEQMGVRVVQPAMAVIMALEGALHFPTAFNLLVDRGEDLDLADVRLLNRSIAGRALRDVRLPGDALVLGVHRDGGMLVPHGDTVLKYGDVLMLVGSPDCIHSSRMTLGSSDT
jgi:Kef-type K+ transport system membrane component KefB/Trk K+ transport system NAD-binding subunit